MGLAFTEAHKEPIDVIVNRKSIRSLLMVTALCIGIAEPNLVAATPWIAARTSRVWCQRRSAHAITKKHEARLVLSLRRITGLSALQFTSDGWLNLGDLSKAVGGSAEARRILMGTLSTNATYIVEDYSGSSSVTFGQAEREQVYDSRNGNKSQVWRLRLDFDDFQQMGAPADVRAAFDEGFTFFHELLHGLGYQDTSRNQELGACEEIVNRLRSEMGLPLRDEYFWETWRITDKLTSVRLRFRSPAGKKSSSRAHYLSFLRAGPVDHSSSAFVP